MCFYIKGSSELISEMFSLMCTYVILMMCTYAKGVYNHVHSSNTSIRMDKESEETDALLHALRQLGPKLSSSSIFAGAALHTQ